MTLSTRVAILEKDVAALRTRMDNADVDRDHIRQEAGDLRAEMHGWAQIAVRADQKMDAAAELMQLIYADVRHTKETLAGLHADVRHTKETLADHGTMLADHGTMLADHGTMLREILARLDAPRS